jgi:hypothetical protein
LHKISPKTFTSRIQLILTMIHDQFDCTIFILTFELIELILNGNQIHFL